MKMMNQKTMTQAMTRMMNEGLIDEDLAIITIQEIRERKRSFKLGSFVFDAAFVRILFEKKLKLSITQKGKFLHAHGLTPAGKPDSWKTPYIRQDQSRAVALLVPFLKILCEEYGLTLVATMKYVQNVTPELVQLHRHTGVRLCKHLNVDNSYDENAWTLKEQLPWPPSPVQ